MECRLIAIPKLYTGSTLLIFNVKVKETIWSIYSDFFVRAIKTRTLTQFVDNAGPDQSAHLIYGDFFVRAIKKKI